VIHIRKICFILVVSLFILILFKETQGSTIFVEVEFLKAGTARLTDFQYNEKNYDYFFTGKGFGEYYVKILDKNKNVLYSEKFGGMDFVIQKNTETGIVTEEVDKIDKSFRLLLPDNSYFINFYKNEEELLSITLPNRLCNNDNKCDADKGESEYLCPTDCGATTLTTAAKKTTTTIQVCNKNNKCEPKLGENYKTCPQDCSSGSKDDYCDKISDGICDPDCTEKEDPDCKKPNMLWIYILIVIVVIGLLILFFTRIRGERGIETTR